MRRRKELITRSSDMPCGVPTPITVESLYCFDEIMSSPQNFTHHILCFLRENKELLEQPDYRRLYDEVVDFQERLFVDRGIFKKENTESNRRTIDFVADLFNRPEGSFERFSKQQVDDYLDHRRAIWRENEEYWITATEREGLCPSRSFIRYAPFYTPRA